MQASVKENREKFIGGSDIPVIMNLSPWKSRFDLLLEKAGYKESEFGGNVFTEYGNEMEAKIRDYINEDRLPGEHFREGKVEIEGETIGTRIHTDGETEEEILEIKTTSDIKENLEDYKAYLVQILFYMMVEEKSFGLLAVYNRPDDLSTEFDPHRLKVYRVSAEEFENLTIEIAQAVVSFTEDLQKVKENPFIEEAELLPVEIPEIAKRIIAVEEQLSMMKKTAEKIKSEKARLKDAMQAAGVKSWKTPNGYKITLVPDGEDKVEEVETFEAERLKSELPEIYMKFTKTEKKLKKGRAGYVKITEPKKGGE